MKECMKEPGMPMKRGMADVGDGNVVMQNIQDVVTGNRAKRVNFDFFIGHPEANRIGLPELCADSPRWPETANGETLAKMHLYATKRRRGDENLGIISLDPGEQYQIIGKKYEIYTFEDEDVGKGAREVMDDGLLVVRQYEYMESQKPKPGLLQRAKTGLTTVFAGIAPGRREVAAGAFADPNQKKK